MKAYFSLTAAAMCALVIAAGACKPTSSFSGESGKKGQDALKGPTGGTGKSGPSGPASDKKPTASKDPTKQDPSKNPAKDPAKDPKDPKDPNSKDNVAGPTDDSDAPKIDEKCDAALGQTQAKLITKELPNFVDGQMLEYELYVTNCDGKQRALTADVILYDLNAAASGVGKGIKDKYEAYDLKSGKVLAQGNLEEVQGSDLFGQVGEQYYHSRTDKPLQVSADADSFRLKISVPPGCCQATGTKDPTTDQKVQTFLRLGKAAPIEKTVLFKAGKPPADFVVDQTSGGSEEGVGDLSEEDFDDFSTTEPFIGSGSSSATPSLPKP